MLQRRQSWRGNAGTGIFYFASRDLTTKIYIQPFWLDDETSIKIAKGELKISEIDAPKQIVQNKISIQSTPGNENGSSEDMKELKKNVNKELVELRTDICG